MYGVWEVPYPPCLIQTVFYPFVYIVYITNGNFLASWLSSWPSISVAAICRTSLLLAGSCIFCATWLASWPASWPLFATCVLPGLLPGNQKTAAGALYFLGATLAEK